MTKQLDVTLQNSSSKTRSKMILFICLHALVACGLEELTTKKSEHEGQGDPEWSIKDSIDPQALEKPENITDLRASFFIQRLASESFVYNNKPKKSGDEGDEKKEGCDYGVGQGHVDYTEHGLLIKAEAEDAETCEPGDESIKFYAELRVNQDRLQELKSNYPDPKSLVDNPDFSLGEERENQFMSYLFYDSGLPNAERSIGMRLVNFTGTEGLEGCTKTAGEEEDSFVVEQCQHISVVKTTTRFNFETLEMLPEGDFAEQYHFYKVVQKNLKGKMGGTYYESGVVEVEFNNWTGTLTYSGADVAPTYSFTSSHGETITGTLKEEN